MRGVKITNPNWMGYIAPEIKAFFERTNPIGITYESLYTYLVRAVQYGRDKDEFWVVFDDDKPMKVWGHWFVKGIPAIGKVYCDCIYNGEGNVEATRTLLREFVEFGKRNRCTIYEADAVNKKVFRVLCDHADFLGFDVHKSDTINFSMRKKKDEDLHESTDKDRDGGGA